MTIANSVLSSLCLFRTLRVYFSFWQPTYRTATPTAQRRPIHVSHPTKMRLYTVTGILFIVAIVDFALALAAPVLAQEKRQASAEIANTPEYDPVTVFGKRGDNVGRIKYIVDYFAAPKVEAAASKSGQGKDSDYVMVQKPPPSSSVSKPGEDSSKTTKSRRSSGTARDGLDAA
jgi:hypothetical protein